LGYEEARNNMVTFVKSLKKKYTDNQIYVSLTKCSKKDCIFCPHSFHWRVSYTLSIRDKVVRRGKYLGKKITIKTLRSLKKEKLYNYFKNLEKQMDALTEKRNYYSKKTSISY